MYPLYSVFAQVTNTTTVECHLPVTFLPGLFVLFLYMESVNKRLEVLCALFQHHYDLLQLDQKCKTITRLEKMQFSAHNDKRILQYQLIRIYEAFPFSLLPSDSLLQAGY